MGNVRRQAVSESRRATLDVEFCRATYDVKKAELKEALERAFEKCSAAGREDVEALLERIDQITMEYRSLSTE
jgi:hypothetical protein